MPVTRYNPAEFQTVVLLGKETTWGQAATTFDTAIPITQPRFQPQGLRHVLDEGFRGQPSVDYDLIPGPGEGTFSFGGNVYLDSIGVLLNLLLGTDTVAGEGPYTHTLKAAPTPASVTVQWQQATQSYNFPGARLSDLTLTWRNTDGALTFQAQGMSKLGQTVSTPATPSWSALSAVAGWQSAVTVTGVALAATLMEGEIHLSRQLQPLHGSANTQDLQALWPLGLKCEARLTFAFETTEAYNYFTGAQKNAVVVTFTQGSFSLQISMASAAWRLVEIEENDGIYQAVAQLTGTHNTTDAGVASAVLTNSRSTAY
jgi:hypothetical protein